jgi:hypothetical protein
MSAGCGFSFLGRFLTTETTAFVAAPLAGEAILAWVLPVLRFTVRYINQSQIIRQFFKWHKSLTNSFL